MYCIGFNHNANFSSSIAKKINAKNKPHPNFTHACVRQRCGWILTKKMLIYSFLTIPNFLFEYYLISYAHPHCSSFSLKTSSMKRTITKRVFLSIKARSIPWGAIFIRLSDLAPWTHHPLNHHVDKL
jgi:hypothetical protein